MDPMLRPRCQDLRIIFQREKLTQGRSLRPDCRWTFAKHLLSNGLLALIALFGLNSPTDASDTYYYSQEHSLNHTHHPINPDLTDDRNDFATEENDDMDQQQVKLKEQDSEHLQQNYDRLLVTNKDLRQQVKDLKRNSLYIHPVVRKVIFGVGCGAGLYWWITLSPHYLRSDYHEKIHKIGLGAASIVGIYYWGLISFKLTQ